MQQILHKPLSNRKRKKTGRRPEVRPGRIGGREGEETENAEGDRLEC